MRSTSSSAWSQGTFSSSAVTVPWTPGWTITFRPLIWAKVRSTSVTSALVTLRSIGSPKYCLSLWLSAAFRCARPCSGVAAGETSTGLPIGALTPGCEPTELAVGAAPRAGATATGPVGEGGAAAGRGETSSVSMCPLDVLAGGLRCASARSEGSGPEGAGAVVVVVVLVVVVVWVVAAGAAPAGAGSTTFAFDVLLVVVLVLLPAVLAGFDGAGAGAAGAGAAGAAGAAATAGAGLPSAAGKEITSAPP